MSSEEIRNSFLDFFKARAYSLRSKSKISAKGGSSPRWSESEAGASGGKYQKSKMRSEDIRKVFLFDSES